MLKERCAYPQMADLSMQGHLWRRISAVSRGVSLATLLVTTVLLVLCASCGGPDKHTGAETTPSTANKPNILFVLTDDQDPESLAAMANVQRLLVERGTT